MKKKTGGITGKGFKKGKSGNPSGRPKTNHIKEYLFNDDNRPKVYKVLDKAIREALKGSFSDRKLVLEYAFGKVQTEVKIDSRNDEPIKVFDFEHPYDTVDNQMSKFAKENGKTIPSVVDFLDYDDEGNLVGDNESRQEEYSKVSRR